MSHMATWKLPPPPSPITPEWEAEYKKWREAYNTCGECGSKKLELRNHSAMWGDGDLICENGHYVRMYDSG